MEQALEASRKSIQDHIIAVEAMLASSKREASEQKVEVNEQFASVGVQLANISSEIVDRPDDGTATDRPGVYSARDELRKSWLQVRDKLEAYASDAEVDGRTRAKYGRIDRRKYSDLLDAIVRDSPEKFINQQQVVFREALELWAAHRSGRRQPTVEEVEKMVELAAKLAN